MLDVLSENGRDIIWYSLLKVEDNLACSLPLIWILILLIYILKIYESDNADSLRMLLIGSLITVWYIKVIFTHAGKRRVLSSTALFPVAWPVSCVTPTITCMWHKPTG